MNWLDRICTRRLRRHCGDVVPERYRVRLRAACGQLDSAEEAVRARMGLCVRPRLILVDEELAVVVPPALRDAILAEQDDRGDP